ncbi:MAG: undecaprenyldiphospho-muramoylpentapeptide beta-N-acetylglucosaminyltransferase [Alphaproteobacteria bacterium]|nr:undecaprenyldiphospho-muramoylpentapeptide beta-N-acetylglucosaminyltransferase [Alphaproteobacteria bacterium]
MSDKKQPLIILTAGGTGGHVYPAEALAQELSRRGFRLMLVTDKRGLNNYRGKLGEIENRAVLSGAVMGKSKWFKIKSLFKLALGVLQSIYIIIRYKPLCVVGFGGYAAFPCTLAAAICRKKLIIHEQNAVMSRTNRIMQKYASAVALSSKNTLYAREDKSILTGMPVRASISDLANLTYTPPGEDKLFKLLIFGGSQGAKIFGDVIPEVIRILPENLQARLDVVQQCRKEEVEELQKKYTELKCANVTIDSFFDNMAELYACGHLIISRAGASSISEIAAAAIPCVLVPLPTAADNHQSANARDFIFNQAGLVIEQKDFSAQRLADVLQKLINAPKILADFSANTKKFAIIDADKRLADVTQKVIKGEALNV